MVVLYTIDLIFFIIRLSLLSNDLSKRRSDTTPFLVPILLFELIGSVSVILCNLLYIFLRHCLLPLIHEHSSFKYLWPVATMTCIRLPCHKDRPQAILLMRVALLGCSFLLKFMCFVIGASCSAYTVIAAFALVLFFIAVNVEFVHLLRFWTYNPTEIRNMDQDNRVHVNNISEINIERTHRRHLGFVPYSLLNDQNAQGFGHSRCGKRNSCQSESLYHYLFYHSLISERDIPLEMLNQKVKKSFIAFYRTSKDEALTIAEKGFPYGNDKNAIVYKDHLHLKKSIYFTLACAQDLTSFEAIICVRLNLGEVKTAHNDHDSTRNRYFSRGVTECDTIYITNKKRLYVRMPGQIEKWLITINDQGQVNDKLDGSFYTPCL